jgi:hypothetical protein
MKKLASLLSVAIMLTTAGVASADIVVYTGPQYTVSYTNPVPVGANPGGEALVGFMMKIKNTTGDATRNPAGFDGATGGRLGFYTDDPLLHHQDFTTSPTLSQELAGNTTATLIDSHFNFLATDVLFVGTAPSETNDLAASVEPLDATGPFSFAATVDFGNRMFGNFSVLGGAAADVDGDADPTTWELLYLVAKLGDTINMNFFVTGINPGETIVDSFVVTPEPVTNCSTR